ncbi:MAG: twin-arginine translocase TatA/TatE family subunit [Nitrospira sp.]|nr:twin-arginine translocase TatA/TatE family subunit [Nitrospira sp.]
MFGTMGFSELMIILVIILIIFGAGRLPQIGEGVGKALKGFKKEVSEIPPAIDPNVSPDSPAPPQAEAAVSQPAEQQGSPPTPPKNQPYQPGPEMTPGTTAALLYQGAGPQVVTPKAPPSTPQPHSAASAASTYAPLSMEDRQAQPAPVAAAQYPRLPQAAQAKPLAKRPAAVVNKQAVARVQAQQAALKAKKSELGPQDMQSLGESLGSTVRTFRDAAADIRNSIDPQMQSIQAELQAAEKEMQETIEVAKQPSPPKEPSGSA